MTRGKVTRRGSERQGARTSAAPLRAGLCAEMARLARELYARGLMTFTGGNLSARDPAVPDRIWITPAGEFKGGLLPGSMICIDLEGKPLSRSRARPSSDYRIHCAIYRRRRDVQAIIHTHAQNAISLGLTHTAFRPITGDAAMVRDVVVVPHEIHGSVAQAEGVAAGLGDGCAVIMQNHGLVVAASDLLRAATLTEAIESTAGMLLTCRLLGVEPPVIPSTGAPQPP